MKPIKNSANIMETTFCNPKDIPQEYLNDSSRFVIRNGQLVDILQYNKRVKRNWKPRKSYLKKHNKIS